LSLLFQLWYSHITPILLIVTLRTTPVSEEKRLKCFTHTCTVRVGAYNAAQLG